MYLFSHVYMLVVLGICVLTGTCQGGESFMWGGLASSVSRTYFACSVRTLGFWQCPLDIREGPYAKQYALAPKKLIQWTDEIRQKQGLLSVR